MGRINFVSVDTGAGGPSRPDRMVAGSPVVFGHELRRSETLLITKSTDCRRCLTFPLGAYFYWAHGGDVGLTEASSAPEVLDPAFKASTCCLAASGRRFGPFEQTRLWRLPQN